MVGDRLEFDVLGPLDVRRDGTPVSVTSTRQRILLAALIVGGRGPVSADRLIDAIWGEDLPSAPRSALNTLLSRLRATLGGDAIESGPTGYRLTHDPDAVDAVRFEALRGRSQASLATEAIEVLDQALSMWRGPAYSEFADREFASAEAMRLDELRNACIEDRADLRLKVGDIEAAVADLEGYVAEHPLSERALELLMTGLYRLGRHGEALHRFGEYRQMLLEELGLDPSPRLSELEVAILNHDLPRPLEQGAPRWLARDDMLVGRQDEMATLSALAEAHRLVTVTGMGGVGKTRLVAESLPGVVDRLGLPATVVELAGTDRVEDTIASSLGIGPSSGDARQATLDYLSITPMLLVLDGCEHVVDRLHRFLDAALGRCPHLRVLASSRRPIGLGAEQVLPIGPLSPPEPGQGEPNAAVRLFVARARRLRPTFSIEGDERSAAAAICRRLDGIPLAIELAAARAAVLGVNTVSDRLAESLDLLGEADDERSLPAALEWSYELLDESERAVLQALAVFEGWFDLDGAERVTTRIPPLKVASSLVGLAEASLVTPSDNGAGTHYRLLEVVRDFARGRLAGSGHEDEVRMAHVLLMRSLVQAEVEAALGPGDANVQENLDAAAADIAAAVSWAMETGQMELAGETTGGLVLAAAHWQLSPDLIPLVQRVAEHPDLEGTAAAGLARAGSAFVATLQGRFEEGERAARKALPEATRTDARYLALLTLGVASLYAGDHDASRRWSSELVAIEGLQPARLSDGHATLALIANFAGERQEARRHLAQARATAEASGSHSQRCFARYVAGEVAASEDPAGAVPILEAAAREADAVGADFRSGLAMTVLAATQIRLGRTRDAVQVLEPLLDLWLRLAVWPQLWTTIRLVAELLATCQRPETAALLLRAADVAADAPPPAGEDELRYVGLASEVGDRIGPEVWEEVSTLATMIPRTQVVDRAMAAVRDLAAT